jgi:hypothetical protein
VVQV